MRYIKLKDDYELVYQGGHHDVYCNGKDHVTTEGGFCHPSIDRNRAFTYDDHSFKCDCKKWADLNITQSKKNI